MDNERYDIIKLLGKGRTGGIYEAKDLTLQRDVAIRRFFSENGETDHSAWEDSFLKIAHNLCNLQHPNLLTTFDAGVDDDGAYMISQLLKGTKLSDHILGTRLSEWEAHELANQILDGLSAAHAAGFIHGALTAGSILMVDRARGGHRFIIMDLGLARLAPLIQGAHSHLGMMAEPSLTAPEMFQGISPNAQSDLYMLGHLCYLCLAQGHPFAGHSLEEIAGFHQSGSLPPITDYRPDLSPEFVAWLEHISATDPADRPQSAADAIRTLPKISPPVPTPSHTPLATTTSQQLKLQLSPVSPSTTITSTVPVSTHLPHTPFAQSKKKSKTPLIIGITIAAVFILVGIITMSSGDKDKPESPDPKANSDQLSPPTNKRAVISALNAYFEFIYEKIYNLPVDQTPPPAHLILDDDDALDWVVYTGIPIQQKLKQRSGGAIIKSTEIIGGFTPGETPINKLPFLIDAVKKTSQVPGLIGPAANTTFKNKSKNGYKITLQTPQDDSIILSVIPYLSGSNTDVSIQFKDKNGNKIGERHDIKTNGAFVLAERIVFEKYSPNCPLIMEITTTGAKDKKRPFSLSLNAIKITD